jgi:hypothetical protein
MPSAYNRPVRVRGVYGDIAQVQWEDNNTMGYVPVADLEETDEVLEA